MDNIVETSMHIENIPYITTSFVTTFWIINAIAVRVGPRSGFRGETR